LPFFLLTFAWVLHQYSANALPVITSR